MSPHRQFTANARGLLFLALGLSLAALSACPAPTGTDAGLVQDSGSPEPQVDAGTDAQRCRERWQLLCPAWASCSESSAAFASFFPSVEECVATGTAQCTRVLSGLPGAPGLAGSIAAERQRFETCTTAMSRSSSCELVLNYLQSSNYHVDLDCLPIDGTLPLGATCLVSDQCQSAYCSNQGGCGKCATQGDVGQACVSGRDCRFGLGCFDRACAPFLEPDAGCAPYDLCPPSMACIEGHCQPQLLDGTACTPGTSVCRLGYCNPSQNKCNEFKLTGVAGGPCGVDVATGNVTGCERGSVCKFFTAASQGVCVARVQDGDRCFFDESFQGSQCRLFSSCVDGVCTPFPEASCGQDGGVHPARRDGGVLPPIDAGADFAASAQTELTLLCDALYACARMQPLRDAWFSGRAACEATLAPISSATGNPHSGWTAAALDGCIAALRGLSACELVDVEFGQPGPAACTAPAGTTAPGVACAAPYECGLQGHCTTGLLSPSCGICATTSGDGGVCAVAEDCGKGLTCANARCIPGGVLTSACSAAQPCNRGLLCKLGVCIAPIEQPGASCNPRATECAGPLVCNSITSTCELPRLVGAPDGGALSSDGGTLGAPCGLLGGGVVDCPNGFACKITNLTTNTGACDVAAAVGEVCTWSGGLNGRGQCLFPGACLDGVCTVGDRNYCQ